MTGLAIGFSLAALIISLVAAGVAAWALIDVQAFRRSTHNIQYVAVDDKLARAENEAMNKQYADIANKSWENLGTVGPMEDQNI